MNYVTLSRSAHTGIPVTCIASSTNFKVGRSYRDRVSKKPRALASFQFHLNLTFTIYVHVFLSLFAWCGRGYDSFIPMTTESGILVGYKYYTLYSRRVYIRTRIYINKIKRIIYRNSLITQLLTANLRLKSINLFSPQ